LSVTVDPLILALKVPGAVGAAQPPMLTIVSFDGALVPHALRARTRT
jgi:hypothetical protein